MANEKHNLSLTAEEIDAALIAAQSAVTYEPQSLTEEQKVQARKNIGAAAAPEPTAYLYNGVELPPLPDWDKTAYPYVIITEAYLERGHVLWVCSEVIVAHENWMDTGKTMLRLNGVTTHYRSWKIEDTEGWEEYLSGDLTDEENVSKGSLTNEPVLWVSFDMRNQENAVYLAASEPVPVYSSESADAVLYTPQTLTDEQKAQARENIGAQAMPVPVAYLYNGITLPPLPELDKAAYPYAAISTSSTNLFGDKATLYVFRSYTYTRTSDDKHAIYATDCRQCQCPMDAQLLNAVGDWSDFSDLEAVYIGAYPGGYTKWVNFDLLGEDGGIFMAAADPVPVYPENGGSGVKFKTDPTLKLENGVLSVNTTNQMEQDNTLPITSAGVYAAVGNIEALLKTI